MKLRFLAAFGIWTLLLTACVTANATATLPPSVTPSIRETPASATKASAPTVAFTLTEALPGIDEPTLPFQLISTAFEQGGPIPAKYSCKGEDISPSLAWGDPPAGTKSLALIMDDPDAPGGTWTHWVVFNISPDLRELPEGIKAGDLGVTFGKNSWGLSDYGGPCPPSGTHRYFFKLYALDTTLNLDKTAEKSQVMVAMEGHFLAEADLMGTFSH
jgi:Raf kinase inhibitor-like YbhB/YbcL family protein